MRPSGDTRQALMRACRSLATVDRGPTLQELAAAAHVGYEAAMHTVKNMTRAGDLTVARERKVDYRNRPVAEYVPADPDADAGHHNTGFVDLGELVSIWSR